MSIDPISIKLPTNLMADSLTRSYPSIKKDNEKNISFLDYLKDSVQTIADKGRLTENLSLNDNDTTEIAMAMDEFLVELNALKALMDESRKAVDRIFQESKS